MFAPARSGRRGGSSPHGMLEGGLQLPRALPTPGLAGLAALTVLPFFAALAPPPARAASLAPSHAGLLRQVHAAHRHHYTYLRTDADVARFVRAGYLVRLPGNRDYVVKPSVIDPYARPAVKLFVERLAGQYREACGRPLVVTSLVRPTSRQPRNSSPLSVHPTGMAMDLRVSSSSRCRRWLEGTLLDLEAEGVLEAAREHHPPHYHVVLFPDSYRGYLARLDGAAASPGERVAESEVETYRVRRGDSLWSIARRHGTTVRTIQRANGLDSTRIEPRQVLTIPVVAR